MYINSVEYQKLTTKTKARTVKVGGSTFIEYCAELLGEAKDVEATAQTEPAMAVVGLQEAYSQPDSQEAMFKHGTDVLAKLSQYHRRLMTFTTSKYDLAEMQQLLAESQSMAKADITPELHDVIREIDMRLAVEVAKLQVRAQNTAKHEQANAADNAGL